MPAAAGIYDGRNCRLPGVKNKGESKEEGTGIGS
jgi:hypothetical protein